MADINQIASLNGLRGFDNALNPTNTNNTANGFVELLKEIQNKNGTNTNQQSESLSLTQNLANNKFTDTTNNTLGTEAFLSSLRSSGKVSENHHNNPIYNFIDTVNAAGVKADKSAAAFAAGYGDELQVAQDLGKADSYLKFFSEVRVKVVNAIRELSRIQI